MHPKAFRIRLSGELDLARHEQLSALLKPAEHAAQVIIDLTDVTYIDSTCLRCFVRLKKAVNDYSGERIHLIGVRPAIAHLFKLTNLDGLFEITESEILDPTS